jgi:hypothetical protein
LLLAPRAEHPVLDTIALAYEMERLRCPEHLDFDLTNADLWAAVASQAGIGYALEWVRALVDTFGAIPAGAWVRVDDGRHALVLGPADGAATLLLLDGEVRR